MADQPVTIATRDYEFIAPLALSDVRAKGIDLTVIRDFRALPRVVDEAGIDGGEASFSRYLQRLAAGDREFVGLPVFLMREFRHRNFFVRRQSPLRGVADLAGTRTGMDAWPNSGNTWSRALLRGAGIGLDQVRWVVGAINPGDLVGPPSGLPPNVTAAPPGRSLVEMLVDGDLDVLISAWPPSGFYQDGSPIVRLIADYRTAERDHYRRTGIYPAHHLVVLRRALVERHPGSVKGLYAAFVEARDQAERARLLLHESSAWALADLEEQRELFGPAYEPYGIAANRAMIAAFCEEQWAQGLIPRPLDPDEAFREFETLVR